MQLDAVCFYVSALFQQTVRYGIRCFVCNKERG